MALAVSKSFAEFSKLPSALYANALCVCVRERMCEKVFVCVGESECECEKESERSRERERERERETHREKGKDRERETFAQSCPMHCMQMPCVGGVRRCV